MKDFVNEAHSIELSRFNQPFRVAGVNLGVEFYRKLPDLPEFHQHHITPKGEQGMIQAIYLPNLPVDMEFFYRFRSGAVKTGGSMGWFESGKMDGDPGH
jgi:hypothetical protein